MTTPTDTLVLPLQQQLCLVAQQVPGIDPTLTVPTPPPGPLEEGMVLFPLTRWAVESATNGRLRLRLTFNALHIFAMRPLDEVIPDLQAYIPGWWQALSAWKNQTLGGLAISLDFSGGDIREIKHNSTEYYALTHQVEVLIQVNISTS